MTPLGEPFAVPDDFDVREYMQRSMWEPNCTVEVHFEANIAARIREDHAPWMRIADQEDGSIVVSFGVTTLDWVVGWVLSYGSTAKVLEPPELIERVRQAAEGALQRYVVSSSARLEKGLE